MITQVENLLKDRMSSWNKTDIEWPNTPFQRADGTPWVRMYYDFIMPTGGKVWSTSGPVLGFLMATLFVPQKTGTSIANPTGDELWSLLQNWSKDGLQCSSGVPKTINWSDPPGWFQRNIKITFEYDQCLEGTS